MSSLLREVLMTFENAPGALSAAQVARALGVTPGTLDGMIQYWVRKGRLREAADMPDCGTCNVAGCPFIYRMPRHYELVSGDDPAPAAPPPAGGACRRN